MISRRSVLRTAGMAVASALAGQAAAAKKPEANLPQRGQMNRGRDEPILDAGRPVIDSHHHLYVRPGVKYLQDEYLQDTRAGHHIVASVYIETNAFARPDGPEILRPLGEVEFANGIGAMAAGGYSADNHICSAIIGHADLRHGAAVGDYLDAAVQRAPERFRGIRQGANYHPDAAPYRYMPARPPAGLLMDPRFRTGFRQLAQRDLLFEAGVFHLQLPELASLADAFPSTTIIINHAAPAVAMGVSPSQRRAVFTEWQKALRHIALRPNVLCKISGLGLPFWGFGFEKRTDVISYTELAGAWRPYVLTVLDIFGAERCMAGSDYPPDGLSAGFVPLWNAFKYITQAASEDEKHAFFCATAARVYQIPWPRQAGGRW
ncbi:amidohydrolase family protein [Enterobacter hormaechei]|uniref:amidohydrolase family protein n=1 Tax=Enterobacter hormaechei TaxID=158836 RepID=UPI003F6DD23A